MNKLVIIFALVAVASAQIITSGGVKDVLGNYYDATTGQVSSSLTGHVLNTRLGAPLLGLGAPLAGHLASPYAAHLASPYAAHLAAPLAAHIAAPLGAHLAAPLAAPLGLGYGYSSVVGAPLGLGYGRLIL